MQIIVFRVKSDKICLLPRGRSIGRHLMRSQRGSKLWAKYRIAFMSYGTTMTTEGAPSTALGGELGDAPMVASQQTPCRRMIITRMELENFKSYAGLQKIGPFHKVRKRAGPSPCNALLLSISFFSMKSYHRINTLFAKIPF